MYYVFITLVTSYFSSLKTLVLTLINTFPCNHAFIPPSKAIIIGLFPAKNRYSGVSMSHALGSAILGGTAPFISSILTKYTNYPLAPAIYLIVVSIIAVFVVISTS